MTNNYLMWVMAWSLLGGGNEYSVEQLMAEESKIEHVASVTTKMSDETNDEVLVKSELQEVLREIEEMIGQPSQIDILDLQYDDSEIILNVSDDITVYGGGNATEYQVVKKLLDWGFENTEVESMTIYIEGEMTLFPEGSMSIPCSRESYEKYYN